MKLPLNKIRLDGGTQPRQRILDSIVSEYMEDMRQGAAFPPVTVFYDGENYWLADGFHRFLAAKEFGLAEMDCDVRQGTPREAQWHSYGANKAHGLRRTNEDKARAVKAALRHSPQRSSNEIARHVGVHVGTVCKYRAEMEAAASASRATAAPLPSKPRIVTRNGTTYVMRTCDIGRRFPRPAKPVAGPAPVAMPSTYVVHLPPGNPLGAAMVLMSRCSREYLEGLVQELRNLMSAGQTH
jgi:hypothetical protein